MLYKEDFMRYFEFCDLEVVAVFGDYDLEEYEAATSDRMIFVVKKN